MFEENFAPTKARTVTASSYLTKQFKDNSDIDWEKLKTQVIGLPVSGNLLVNKVNVENIIWQEIINAGNVGLAFDYFNSGTSNSVNSEKNFLKLLADSTRKDIKPYEQFVIRFAEKKLQESKETDSSFWTVILILSKTELWRTFADKVLNLKEEDHKIEDDGESEKTSRAGFNEFGNFSTDAPKVTVSIQTLELLITSPVHIPAPEDLCSDSPDREGYGGWGLVTSLGADLDRFLQL